MSVVPLQMVLTALESGARPAGGVTADSGEIASVGGEHLNSDGGFDFTSIKRIPRSFFEAMRGGRIVPRDILVVKDGATTGKTSFVREDFPFQEAAVNEHVFCVRVDQSKASPEYVFHFLRSPLGKKAINLDFRGATVGGISREFATKTRLPLPSLPEQRRIAEILDKADALRVKRRAVLAQLDTLTQSILLDMFGDPAINPKGMPTKTLDELCRGITDIDHKMPLDVEEGVPFISAKDLTDEGRISFDNVKRISREDFQRLSRKSKPERDDIIYSRIGVNLGKARLVNVDFDFLASYSCCTIKPNRQLVDVTYLCSLLDSPFILRQAHKGVRAIAVPDLGMGEIRAFRIIVPPLTMQCEFARRVRAVETLRAAQRASLQELGALFSGLQHCAFRGELSFRGMQRGSG